MIDWIKAIIPFEHSELLNDGCVTSFNSDGVIEWTTNKRLSIEGSHDSSFHIQSEVTTGISGTGIYTHIIFDGNPVKFFQGHNLWGTDDLMGLMIDVVIAISNILGIRPTSNDWAQIISGHYQLKRVDSTMMISLGTKSDVQAFLYSAERTAHMRYKGQGIMTKGTLYFGKHSRRESLKMYAKGVEIRAKGHELPKSLQNIDDLYNWADDKLRLEACTRSMQLKDLGLQLACNWNLGTPMGVLNRLLSGLNMSEQHTLSPSVLDGLSPRLVAVYHLWKEGHDIRAMYPPTTFKRYRKSMQESAGIDIAIKQGNRSEPNPNVIDFRRVLNPERSEHIPSWAIGTPLYFEPRVKTG
jgi:II/X family phage/plasmid replication protein